MVAVRHCGAPERETSGHSSQHPRRDKPDAILHGRRRQFLIGRRTSQRPGLPHRYGQEHGGVGQHAIARCSLSRLDGFIGDSTLPASHASNQLQSNGPSPASGVSRQLREICAHACSAPMAETTSPERPIRARRLPTSTRLGCHEGSGRCVRLHVIAHLSLTTEHIPAPQMLR